tara:strand:- start:2348 stop:2506 length:159 start_codon:yes stop_codon:yes gene_type:complete
MEEHRLRINKKDDGSVKKLNEIIDRLTRQRDYYKNELSLIEEGRDSEEKVER